MELRIDTKRDSVDDIKKAIRFLEQFLEQHGIPSRSTPTNMFEQNTPVMPMSTPAQQPSTPVMPTSEPSPNLNPLNMFNETPSNNPASAQESVDDDLKIIEY